MKDLHAIKLNILPEKEAPDEGTPHQTARPCKCTDYALTQTRCAQQYDTHSLTIEEKLEAFIQKDNEILQSKL